MPPWRNRYTRQVEGLCPYGRAGSSPVGGTHYDRRNLRLMAKFSILGRIAQLVRASGLHPEGRGFEPLFAHSTTLVWS